MKDIKSEKPDLLIIAIGNPSRGDDGLGWAFADNIRAWQEKVFDIEYRYQLQVEDSELISRYGMVLFVDASHTHYYEGSGVKKCTAARHYRFSSHAQSPENILYLSCRLYNKMPRAYILGISGKVWDMKSELSPKAQNNLGNAMKKFKVFLKRHLATV